MRDQLYWFVNKLVLLSKTPVALELYDVAICFPVDLLRKEETGLFPLGRYEGSVGFDSEDQEYAFYCGQMLEKIKSDIYKLENKYLHFNEEKFSWHEDNRNYYGHGYAFFIDCDHRSLFEAYLSFMDSNKTESEFTSLKDRKVEYDEVTSTIIIDGKKCSLPVAKNEDYLAVAMFSREIDEPIDWSIIYKEMSGSKSSIGSQRNKKALADTIKRLNERIKKIFGTEDKLISCENDTVKRNY
ncbi:MAG: hypothetical protein Q7S43_02245 [bacterium]|nr:hypothetical protein [bacterium]